MIKAIFLAAGQSKRLKSENKLTKLYKKTHENRCQRLKEAGFSDDQINSIHGPIGIKLGGRSAPEIALSIIAQLVSETYKK